MASSTRYECCLTEEDLHYAANELNEPTNNNDRLKKIDELRNSLSPKHLQEQLIDTSDETLLQFLRSREFNVNEALTAFCNYHSFYESWPELIDKVKNPDSVKHIIEEGLHLVTNERAVDGSAVFISRVGIAEGASFIDSCAAFIVSMNCLVKDERNQIYGITGVFDRGYMTFEFVQQVRPFWTKKLANLFTKALPIRIRSLNFVYDSTFFSTIFGFLLNFFNSQTKSLINVHGKNFDSLHKLIKPSALPPRYGGTGLDFDVLIRMRVNAIYGQDHKIGLRESGIELIL